MSKILGESWKTSLFGYGSAIAIAAYPILVSGKVDPHALIVAAATALIGRFAKDAGIALPSAPAK